MSIRSAHAESTAVAIHVPVVGPLSLLGLAKPIAIVVLVALALPVPLDYLAPRLYKTYIYIYIYGF